MSLRVLSQAFSKPLRGFVTRTARQRASSAPCSSNTFIRGIQTSPSRRDRSFTNLLADEVPPAIQVNSITEDGILLSDGLLLPSSCIFHDGHVFLWDVPLQFWQGWEAERFEFFESTVPRPEILVFGTGKTLVQPPPFLRSYLNKLGIQLDVMDTRNACSTYNLLTEEGRRVSAALLPLSPRAWHKLKMSPTSNTSHP